MNEDQPIVCWPCYEPASQKPIELTESDLVQHVLLIGSTGSGKSTLLTSATRQVIRHEAKSSEDKAGLLILDAKSDDLVHQVREAAKDCGRADDVVVLGPQGDHSLDLFGQLHSLDDVERLTRQLMLGTEKFSRENAYWDLATTAMISAAFTLIVVARIPPTFDVTTEFLRRWFLSPSTPSSLLEMVHRLNNQTGARHPLLATALDQVELFKTLDPRTKSNLQSCLINVLRPILSPAAGRCLSSVGRATFNPTQAVHAGKICLISVNALAEPDLARFLFRLAKDLFFEAVQLRQQPARLCGFIADEFPLVVTPPDVEQLATIRSKRCFAICAIQGNLSLSERIGPGPGRAVLNHFNTVVYLRNREAETALQAFIALGTRAEIKSQKPTNQYGGWSAPNPPPRVTEVPVCPMGALGQLSPHQAYVVFANGRRTPFPVWFAPWFELEPSAPVPPPLESHEFYYSTPHVEELMRWAGFRRRWSAEVVTAASHLLDHHRRDMVEVVTVFFSSRAAMIPKGLDQLPESWLAALPGILWKLKKREWTHLPYFIDRVKVQDGMLLLHFAQEQTHTDERLTVWDKIRITVNANIYPNNWRPLSQRHRKQLGVRHPELRAELKGETPAIE